MSRITTLVDLKEYCLRRLGKPVIQINVSEEQIWDRIADAIQYFNEFHADSTARIFHKYQITQDDIDRQYLIIPDEITHVKRILPLQSGGQTASSSLLNPSYQIRLSDFLSFNHIGSSMVYWTQLQSHYKMIEMQFNGTQQEIEFTRYNHQLRILVDWKSDISVGQWIIIEAERLLLNSDGDSPCDEPSDIYDDQFLKALCTALIKYQWGQNLSKFDGVQLPGGVTFSGTAIMAEAKEEIDKIKEDARAIWENPIGFFVG